MNFISLQHYISSSFGCRQQFDIKALRKRRFVLSLKLVFFKLIEFAVEDF